MTRPPINLDARAAAHREARGEPPALIFRGREYALPVTLTLDQAEVLNNAGEDMRAVVLMLLGPEQAAMFLASDPPPDLDDMVALAEVLSEAYGADAGESLASPASSPSTGTPPRPVSPPSTASAC